MPKFVYFFFLQKIKICIIKSNSPISFTSKKLNFQKLKRFDWKALKCTFDNESLKRCFDSSPNLEKIGFVPGFYENSFKINFIESCLFEGT